ncbi:MAG: pantoate--beta-alanine ligase [Chloroflexota bacterium]|jgi:pantoate--beta-alanine ligase|nr:pantoate--beta-alanine ligase [Chloroflexota bacterium]MDH5243663.1 pantoate--beta-alanine ligase [Chloroflexota bacterium]
MRVVRTRAALRAALADAARPIGLVPTMGWLHEGHLSLIERARLDDASVVVSIFVNPRQFGETTDFTRYPRNEARDLEICATAGVDLVFAPSVEEVYPVGFDTTVSVGGIARPLEGAARPGHFEGVATVVAILFSLVGAERAYFGTKDAQQVRVIRRMALDLALPTEVVPCPTIREADGLAMSSRNARLSPAARAAAPVIRRALLEAHRLWEEGERSGAQLRAAMRTTLASEPLARVEYVSVADDATLAELEVVDRPALLSLAVRFDEVRLIDNEPLP